VSSSCEFNRLDVFPCTSYPFGWPVRSVERLAPPNFSGLKAPVLVIGNTADPTTSFVSAQSTAKLLGDRATLVEQLGVGHTSVAQYSTCTLGIVINFVTASKVGPSLSRS
jgi:hypothetical protein